MQLDCCINRLNLTPMPTPPVQTPFPLLQSLTLACPLCRGPLPMGPNEVFLQNFRAYVKIYRLVQRGDASWTNLSAEQQSKMDQALVVLIEAAGNARSSWFNEHTASLLLCSLSFLILFCALLFRKRTHRSPSCSRRHIQR